MAAGSVSSECVRFHIILFLSCGFFSHLMWAIFLSDDVSDEKSPDEERTITDIVSATDAVLRKYFWRIGLGNQSIM